MDEPERNPWNADSFLFFTPEGSRTVATGEAQSADRRTKRNPWKRVSFSRACPGGAEETSIDVTVLSVGWTLSEPTPIDHFGETQSKTYKRLAPNPRDLRVNSIART